MKKGISCLLFLVVAGLLTTETVQAQGTAFTYQGRLNNGGNAASGSYDLTFTLYTTNSGGSAFAGPLTNNAVGITNGLFTVALDFGSGVFNGDPRWLEIGVRTNGNGSFATLSPRQPLLPAPYAIFANTASQLTGNALLQLDNQASIVANNTVSTATNNVLATATNLFDALGAAQAATNAFASGILVSATNNVLIVATNAANLIGILPQYPTVQIATNVPFTNAVLISPDGTNRVWGSVFASSVVGLGSAALLSSNAIVFTDNPVLANAVTNLGTYGISQTNYVLATNLVGYLTTGAGVSAANDLYPPGPFPAPGATNGCIMNQIHYPRSPTIWEILSPDSGTIYYTATDAGGFPGTWSSTSPDYDPPPNFAPVYMYTTSTTNYYSGTFIGTYGVYPPPYTAPVPTYPRNLALTPPLGYNGWNYFQSIGDGQANATEDIIQYVVTNYAVLGLTAYKNIVVDEGWNFGEPVPRTGSYLTWNTNRFSDGIPWMAAFTHTNGFKFGLHISYTATACSGEEGSLGYYTNDVQTFADWGIDFLKIDSCDLDMVNDAALLRQFSGDFQSVNRPMITYFCAADFQFGGIIYPWMMQSFNMVRNTTDRPSIIDALNNALPYLGYAGPGHWVDIDSIGPFDGDTNAWIQSLSVCAEMPFPIFLSQTNFTPQEVSCLTNANMLAINQDPLGSPAQLVSSNANMMQFQRALSDGSMAILLFNTSGENITTTFTLPTNTIYNVLDCWQGTNFSTTNSFTVMVTTNSMLLRATPYYQFAGTFTGNGGGITNILAGSVAGLGNAALQSTNFFDLAGAGAAAAQAVTNGYPWGTLYDSSGAASAATNGLSSTNFVNTAVLNGTNNLLTTVNNVVQGATNNVLKTATNSFDALGAAQAATNAFVGTLNTTVQSSTNNLLTTANSGIQSATNNVFALASNSFDSASSALNATNGFASGELASATNNVLATATNAANLIGNLPQYPQVQIATNAPFTNAVLISPDGTNRVWSNNYRYTIANIITNSSTGTNQTGSLVALYSVTIPSNTLTSAGQTIAGTFLLYEGYNGSSVTVGTGVSFAGTTLKPGTTTFSSGTSAYGLMNSFITYSNNTTALFSVMFYGGNPSVLSVQSSGNQTTITGVNWATNNVLQFSASTSTNGAPMTAKWGKVEFVP